MKPEFRFIAIAAASAAAVVLAGGGSAVADRPQIAVNNTSSDLPASYCGFPVHVGVVADNEYYIHQTQEPDGSVVLLVTGKLFMGVENTTTGRTIEVNASGPGRDVFYPDGSISAERTGSFSHWATPAQQAQFGLPGLFPATGLATATLDTSGTITSFHSNGKVTDLCAALS
jgi:hypothetical protein